MLRERNSLLTAENDNIKIDDMGMNQIVLNTTSNETTTTAMIKMIGRV